MAAFCTCCGAEITLKAEACPVCGTPRHGMALAPDSLAADDIFESPPRRPEAATKSRGAAPRRRACCVHF
jgi:hypothetical protein